jgi:hypothetical protein
MDGLEVSADAQVPEEVELGQSFIVSRHKVVIAGRLAKSIGPQRHVDSLWPASLGKQELLARSLGEIADSFLSNTILEVSIDTTEGNRLIGTAAVLNEGVVLEPSIVGMVVTNGDSMVSSKALEGFLGTDSFIACEVGFHEEDELES